MWQCIINLHKYIGPTKVSRPEFIDTVVKILADYDIVMIQEIRDSTQNNEVFQVVVNALNAYVR